MSRFRVITLAAAGLVAVGAAFGLGPPELGNATIEYDTARGLRNSTVEFEAARGIRNSTIEYARVRGLRHATIVFDLFEEGRQIEVFPLSVDFGSVPIGSAIPQIVTITNVGFFDLTVSAIDLTGDAGFALVEPSPTVPFVLAQGEVADVTIEFMPQFEGLVAATLEVVSDDLETPSVLVSIVGTGEPEPPSGGCLEQILVFIAEKMATGELVGNGPGNSGPHRLNALINKIEAAGDMAANGNFAGAANKLMNAKDRTDGVHPPPDFAAGPAATELAQRLQDCIDELQP